MKPHFMASILHDARRQTQSTGQQRLGLHQDRADRSAFTSDVTVGHLACRCPYKLADVRDQAVQV
jgi:hypothetical protein